MFTEGEATRPFSRPQNLFPKNLRVLRVSVVKYTYNVFVSEALMKSSAYTAQLSTLSDWTPFLRENSGLPGPRGNLELAHAAAALDPLRLEPYLALDPQSAPENTPECFLAFCGVLGLGIRLARGESPALYRLRAFAVDPRWRVREAVATALQLWGDADLPALLAEMPAWAFASALEQRAAMAALCEPRLLVTPAAVAVTLQVLDSITASLERAVDRRNPAFQALRQALGYGWSVAMAADFDQGRPRFERWLSSPDRDVRWMLRENLKKNRLERRDPAWVASLKANLE
jgi:hypothetical protein